MKSRRTTHSHGNTPESSKQLFKWLVLGMITMVGCFSSGCSSPQAIAEAPAPARLTSSQIISMSGLGVPAPRVVEPDFVDLQPQLERHSVSLVSLTELQPVRGSQRHPGQDRLYVKSASHGRTASGDQSVAFGALTPITHDGYYLTAAHTLHPGAEFFVATRHLEAGVQVAPARVVWISREADVALVHSDYRMPHHYDWREASAERNDAVKVDKESNAPKQGRLLRPTRPRHKRQRPFRSSCTMRRSSRAIAAARSWTPAAD